jgi:hypothetical protein
MMLQIARIGAVTWYEIRMHWRGRALLVIMLSLAVINLATALIMKDAMVNLSGDLTEAIVAIAWIPLNVTVALLLPLALADSIAKDTQWDVREIIDSTPLPNSSYLLGKLLGAWGASALGLLGLAIASGVMWWLVIGPFSLGPYVSMWLTGALALVVINGGLGVLLPATQPTRRRATAFAGIAFGLLMLPAMNINAPLLVQYFSPLRLPMILYYVSGLGGDATAISSFTYDDTLMTIAAGVIELVVVGAAVWGWFRWQEVHR